MVRAGVVSWKMECASPWDIMPVWLGLASGTHRVIAFSFHFLSSGDICMMSSYPLSRCPACKKAFRMEINCPTTTFADPGADGLPPLRPEFPALRPEVPERTKPAHYRLVAFQTSAESSFSEFLARDPTGGRRVSKRRWSRRDRRRVARSRARVDLNCLLHPSTTCRRDNCQLLHHAAHALKTENFLFSWQRFVVMMPSTLSPFAFWFRMTTARHARQ